MSTQNLSEATELFQILGKYIPDIPDEDVLTYINNIFENIKKDGNYQAYFDAIQLMSGETVEEITKRNSIDVLELFIKLLMDWRIIELVAFFRNVGYK